VHRGHHCFLFPSDLGHSSRKLLELVWTLGDIDQFPYIGKGFEYTVDVLTTVEYMEKTQYQFLLWTVTETKLT